CSSSGGMFNNYAVVQGVDHIVPVDIYLPGCPPRPEMLINALLELHKQVQTTPLGVNRVEAARAAEEAAMKTEPTSHKKGLLARVISPATKIMSASTRPTQLNPAPQVKPLKTLPPRLRQP